MSKILLSIHNKYSQGILSKIKKYEVRRSIPKREVKEIVIYETNPTSKVVGIVKVKKTHTLDIEGLWNLTSDSNMLNKRDFFEYFDNKEYGHAFEIKSVRKFKKPQPLSKYSIKTAPQGFIYLD